MSDVIVTTETIEVVCTSPAEDIDTSVVTTGEAIAIDETTEVIEIEVAEEGPQGPPGPTGPSISSLVIANEDLAQYIAVTATGFEADSNNPAHRARVIGITLTAIANGFSGYAVTEGQITNSGWSWVTGDRIYLNGTSLSTIAPSIGFSQQIGIAIASDTIDVNIQPSILL